MGKPIYSTHDKMKAVLIQSELQSEGIETIVVYGNSPANALTFLDPRLYSSWQIVAHDQDVQKAVEILKEREASDLNAG